MSTMSKITPCLWFDGQAEEAAAYYTSIFEGSEILDVVRYGEVGHGTPGTVMTVSFRLGEQTFVAVNGGPQFTFDEVISFQIDCHSQEEVDAYWEALTADGGEEGPCGWLKDRYGVSWQVVPDQLIELLKESGDDQVPARAMEAMLKMKKIDIAALEEAVAAV